MFVALNFKNFDIKHNDFLNRSCAICVFMLNSNFLIYNGINFKKLIILKFYLNKKAGEFFFTRSLFSFLKKNKKITKR